MFFAYYNEDPFAQVRFFTWPSTFWCFHGGQFFLFYHVIHLYIKPLVFRYDLLIYFGPDINTIWRVFLCFNGNKKRKKENKRWLGGLPFFLRS